MFGIIFGAACALFIFGGLAYSIMCDMVENKDYLELCELVNKCSLNDEPLSQYEVEQINSLLHGARHHRIFRRSHAPFDNFKYNYYDKLFDFNIYERDKKYAFRSQVIDDYSSLPNSLVINYDYVIEFDSKFKQFYLSRYYTEVSVIAAHGIKDGDKIYILGGVNDKEMVTFRLMDSGYEKIVEYPHQTFFKRKEANSSSSPIPQSAHQQV